VILDLPRFVTSERIYWNELQALLERMRLEPGWHMSIPEIERLHYLYERCSADLVRLDTFATEPQLRAYVESLVSRAYAEIHETRARAGKIQWGVFIAAFPRAFRRHLGAFRLAVGLTLAGCAFGWFAIRADPDAKAVLMPFPQLMGSPAKRVAEEESMKTDRLHGHKASFSAQLMTHNIQVTVMTLAAGVTWGVGHHHPAFLQRCDFGRGVCGLYGRGLRTISGWHGSCRTVRSKSPRFCWEDKLDWCWPARSSAGESGLRARNDCAPWRTICSPSP
jgi:hypothetical protein